MSRWLHWFPFSVFCLTKLRPRCQWSWILSGTSGKESTSEIFQGYTWNKHNIVNQLYSNKLKKKNLSDCWHNPVPCGWRIKMFLLAASWGFPVAPPDPCLSSHMGPHIWASNDVHLSPFPAWNFFGFLSLLYLSSSSMNAFLGGTL